MSTILFLLAEGLSLRLTCWPPKITLSLHISFLLKWCRALQLALGLISIPHSLTLGNFFPTFWTSLFHWSLLCFFFVSLSYIRALLLFCCVEIMFECLSVNKFLLNAISIIFIHHFSSNLLSFSTLRLFMQHDLM